MKTEQKIFGSEITKEHDGYAISYRPIPHMRWLDHIAGYTGEGAAWITNVALECVVDVVSTKVEAFEKKTITVCGTPRTVVPGNVIFSLPNHIQKAIHDDVYLIHNATETEKGNSQAP